MLEAVWRSLLPYAVKLHMNVAAELALRHLSGEIALAGLVDDSVLEATRPYITVAVYEDIRREQFIARLTQWAEEKPAQVIQLSQVGAFLKKPATVFLAPAMTDDLYRLHREFHERFRDIAYRPWAYYLPDIWAPHCTLAEDLTPYAAGRALEIVLDLCPHISGTVESVSLLTLDPVQTLATCDLMGR